MTQHYFFIRREVYEFKKTHKSPKWRSFDEIIRLFKPLNWILFTATMISFITILILSIISSNSIEMIPWVLIPVVVIITSLILYNYASEKRLYNEKSREKEIMQEKEKLYKQLYDIQSIFKKYGMDDKAVSLIKKECEERINGNRLQNSALLKRVFDIIIIAPVAALLASLMDASKQVNIYAILIILFFGFFSWVVLKATTPFREVWNNIHKDQCLLDALNDLEFINSTEDNKK